MPNNVHTVAAGDTFESLATFYFGEPSGANRIKNANPGTFDPLVPGTTLLIPSPSESRAREEPLGVSLRIDGTVFRHITKLSLTRALDSVDIVSVETPLADTPEFRELITPFAFRRLEVSDSGTRLFRGTLVNVAPKVTSKGSTVRLGGYSIPGVLGDCTAPTTQRLQFRNMNIFDIADQLADPFLIDVVRDGDIGGPFKRVKLKRDKKIWGFLADLAKQRQLLLRSDVDGSLVIAAPPDVGAPVAKLREDQTPLMSVSASFAPQGYYSHITGVQSTKRRRKGAQHAIKNERAVDDGVLRPLTMSIKDVDKGELPRATTAAVGRMLAGSIAYKVKVATWYDENGDTWAPGATVELTAPSVFVPEPYTFQIRAAVLDTSPEGSTAELELMLPGAFGGVVPQSLPWP